jgi:hypothetical protein
MKQDDPCERESDFTYEVSSNESVSEGVVTAVSAVSGNSPISESPSDRESEQALEPLYNVVDPDALDSVFRTGRDNTAPNRRVTFPYHGYEVTVHSEDCISVARPEP